MALAISGDGRVVVGYSHSQNGTEAFRWRDGVIESLGGFPGSGEAVFTIAHAASHDGSVIVGSGTFRGRTQSFIFDGTLKPLFAQAGEPPISEAWGVSADGSVVTGQQQRGKSWDAFVWNRGVASVIAAPKEVTSMVGQAICASGTRIVGTLESPRGAQAFLYEIDGQGLHELGDLPGGAFGSAARALSADGNVVIGSATSSWGIEGFAWSSGTMVGLGALSDHHELNAYAHAVSADGSVIVGTSESEGGRDEAFIWDAKRGMRSLRDVLTQECGLDLGGWWLTDATGISDDGRTITGYGKNPQKFTEGWVAHLGRTSKGTSGESSSPVALDQSLGLPVLDEPTGAAISHDGTIYIAESSANRISVFDKSMQRLRQITRDGQRSWTQLVSIAIGSDRRLYAVDEAGRVFVLDSADEVVASWGSAGDGPGQLNHPRAIAVHDGRVYVADTLNDRIVLFDLGGAYIASFGSPGQDRGQFHQPRGIAIDTAGNAFVADTGNHRIQKFDSTGKFVGGWGDRGTTNGLFIHPGGLACINDRLYIADTGNHRVQVFDLNGNLQSIWGAREMRPHEAGGRLMYPAAIALSPDGQFAAICEPMENRCQVFDCAAGAQPSGSDTMIVPPVAPPRPFIGASIDVAGHFAAVLQPDRDSIDILDVAALDPAPRIIATVGEYGSKFGQLVQPMCARIDPPRKRILVSDAGNHRLQVFEFNSEWTGNVLTPPAAKLLRAIDLKSLQAALPLSPGALDIVIGDIELGPDGEVMLLDVSNQRVLIFDAQFAFVRAIGQDAAGRSLLGAPVDMALRRDGQVLYVLDPLGCQVHAFNLSGEQLFSWGKPGTNASEFYNPRGMTAGADGSIYVTDDADRVQKFDERGGFVMQWGRRGVGAREFFKPRGVAQDDQGRLYIDDWGNHRVQVFGPQNEFRGTFGAALYLRRAKYEQD